MNIDVCAEIKSTIEIESQALTDFSRRIEEPLHNKALKSAVAEMEKSLDSGGKVIVTGLGKSGRVGQKIAATFSSTGSLSVFLHPTEALHGDLGIVTPKDCVLAISYSGQTKEILDLLAALRSLSVPTVALSGKRDSELAKQSTHFIDVSVSKEACPETLAPTASTTLVLAVGDALALALMRIRDRSVSDFARNHPGGSLGRLHLRVKDLMHPIDRVPSVPIDEPVESVVLKATEGKLGAVIVTRENNQIAGLITDGDLRRALQKKEKFFTLKASEIMTAEPLTIDPSRDALSALRLMEDRASQISVLPVIDSNTQNCIGLIRVHDIIKEL